MSQGDQKAHKSAIENLELATFSKQAHNEECSQQVGEVWTKMNFLKWIIEVDEVTYFLDLLYLENHPQSFEIQ